MKKTAFKVLASLTEEELEFIYELTYKYGWLVSEERQEGWLPDRAYIAKAKIEGELNPWIDHGLDALANTYSEWLGFHLPEDWVESMMESYEGEGLDVLANQFDRWARAPSAMLSPRDIHVKLIEAAWEALGGADFFTQDTDYLYESYGPEFIDSYISDMRDIDNAAKFQEDWDAAKESSSEYEAAGSFIYDHALEVPFDAYVEGIGFGGSDWFGDTYSMADISEQFPSLLTDRDFFNKLYSIYLENFPGLDEEIDGISQMYSEIESVEGAPLSDKILTFQLGLTTAHHHGTMADHLLEVPPGVGADILDKVSSGPNVDLWNKELEQIIGFKTPSEKTPEYFIPASSLHVAIASIQKVLAVL